jgi:hypothetical protein
MLRTVRNLGENDRVWCQACFQAVWVRSMAFRFLGRVAPSTLFTGVKEVFTCPSDALERVDHLDDRGIRAELVKEVEGQRFVLLA